MDTKKHYEDEIYRVKTFIHELSVVQDKYFKELRNSLGMTGEGNAWLWCYIFNNPFGETFDEYLTRHGKTFGELK
jgi:hypothetical protein